MGEKDITYKVVKIKLRADFTEVTIDVMSWQGGKIIFKIMDMCLTNPLCCTSEANATL